MSSPYLSPYEDPDVHERISALIRRRSSNRLDVRSALLRCVDLSSAEEILDLGCGFGFWAEDLAKRVAPAARFIGIDPCDRNARHYVRAVEESGRRADFLQEELYTDLPFDGGRFDVVVAAYSLYFFVDVIPEVARVLRPDGRFLAVTHSQSSFTDLLRAMRLSGRGSPLPTLIRRFSSENGVRLLSRSFRRVDRIDYRNSLRFGREDGGDLAAYLRFKLPLLAPEGGSGAEGHEVLMERAARTLRRDGRLIIQKNDSLFICGVPDGA